MSKFQASPTVVAEFIDGEAVLLNLASSTYFRLNEVGACVWKLLDRNCSSQEMVDHLVELYDVERDTAHRDVEQLLRSLREEGLVEMVGAPDPT